jgi:hypothetical protein
MKMQSTLIGFSAMLMLSSLTIHAEPLDIKLGLWEVTYKTDMSGATIPEDALKSMPPERRAKMLEILKNRKAKTHTVQSCITRDNLDRPFKGQDKEEHCSNTIVTATRTKAEYKFQCSGEEARNGVMKTEALSRESIKNSMLMQVNSGKGSISNESTGKWISADCGKVKAVN